MEHLLKQAIKLRKEKKYAQSKEILIGLTNFTRDAEVLYQCAWIHDVMGLETEAMPYYNRQLQTVLKVSHFAELISALVVHIVV